MAYSYVRYTGNGSTVNYTFSFSYLDPSHIKVSVNGVLTDLFTFLNSSTITMLSTPATGSIIEIRRVTPIDTPVVNFADGSVLLERDLDLLALYNLYTSQESSDNVSETISVDSIGRWDGQGKRLGNLANPITDDEAVNKGTLGYEYPAVAAVAASVANVNIVGSDLGAISSQPQDLGFITDAATETSPSSTSKITIVAGNIADVNLVADNMAAVQNAVLDAAMAAASASTASTAATAASTSATAAAASATAAAESEASVAFDASTATTQAGIATTKAGEAATSATNAASSATSASTSASTATTKASEASASATAASTSATNAAASAASTAALLDSFDDRYLGPKSSAPTVDNDGNALVVGALYFDTTSGKMRVNTASGWVDASSASQAALTVYRFTATASQTTFVGASNDTTTLAYLAGGIVVTLNGVVLVGGGDDYTATNGTSVVLTSGAAAGDLLEVYAFSSFSIASLNGSALVDDSVTAAKFAPILDLGVLS